MDKTAPASELERRKQLRIRLRRDLAIEPQKYEGKTYFVIKDPVSLRYYRLKENENYLLQFLDGQHTLDDAQKSYEKQFRPERLRLEDLEGFAQQLLTAGLAQNDSPKAGQQLFERRTKRRRNEWMQALTNILYIKIPIIDPDRLLTRMLRYLGFIFTRWFFILSMLFMASAAALVTTHFEIFRSKLPNYQEFFNLQTVVYLWGALGIVKVIHEFGHGLSCKKFGGEVHEMGALFLCFSPALYCNVSDAWTLPNKWHRIIISAAGIYVELIIASAATFLWWNTPSQPFIHNLSLSLMVVCSVSTVVFNANPLMRYDGYYVMADWLEIPNLRERSNRFLQNTFLETCLGIEVVPEPYMATTRKVLFIAYALCSYIYRWVVTFAILYFMYSFLRPYKLEVISNMLTVAALGSMFGWPIFRVVKNLHRRGRLPDMKPLRVAMTAIVFAGLVLFVCLVPVPISRVRVPGLVQPHPEATAKVFVRYPGLLEKLKVRDGQTVTKGEELAEFSNRELEADMDAAQTEMDINNKQAQAFLRQKELTSDQAERNKLDLEITRVYGDRDKALTRVRTLDKIKRKELVLLAPRDGIVSGAPRPDDIGKSYEKDPTAPFCSITEPGRLRVALPIVTPEFNQLKENVTTATKAAQKAYQRLHRKVSIRFEKTPLADCLADLEKQTGTPIRVDTGSGVAADLAITAMGEKRRCQRVLEEICDRNGLGYIVVSRAGEPQDGWVLVRPGRERGEPEGSSFQIDLPVTLRVQGRDAATWQGRLTQLPESEAREVPLALSSRGGGPVAVKGNTKSNALVPQTQHYLVYVDILDSDGAIVPGNMSQVKIYCKPETILHWFWRTINNTFDLGLL